jgi:hypothetical protein
MAESFVRTAPPFGHWISPVIGKIKNNGQYFERKITSTVIWDKIDLDGYCYYVRHLSMPVIKRSDKRRVSFIADSMFSTFSAGQNDVFDPRLTNHTCLLSGTRNDTEFYALNQDLVISFTPFRDSRRKRGLEQDMVQYGVDKISDELNRVKSNLDKTFCELQDVHYGFQLRSALLDPSPVLSYYYQKPVKAILQGDLFAIHPCKIIPSNLLQIVPSLRTTFLPQIYSSLGIPVGQHRCFSRPLAALRYLNETVYYQITPTFELSRQFAFTKACDGAGDYLFRLGENYYHFIRYDLKTVHKITELINHGKNIECLLEVHNDTGYCENLPVLRFVDTYEPLHQDMTRHLEFVDLDPRIYNNTELKSYFSVLDISSVIAFLQNFKEAIYHNTFRNSDPVRLYKHFSDANVRSYRVPGQLDLIGSWFKRHLSAGYRHILGKIFLSCGAFGGCLNLLVYIFRMLSAPIHLQGP